MCFVDASVYRFVKVWGLSVFKMSRISTVVFVVSCNFRGLSYGC